MRKPFIAAIACCLVLAGCAEIGRIQPYGTYRVAGEPAPREAEAFSLEQTPRNVTSRWYPTHVVFAPDDSHLLVSLCHTVRTDYCRTAKYHFAAKRWEFLPAEPNLTYRWPVYSPDGSWFVSTVYECNQAYRCAFENWSLMRFSADGKEARLLAKTNAKRAQFSPDGKRLIYWTRKGGTDVAEFDLTTGQERMLTQFSFDGSSELQSSPLYLDDGKRFIFNASLVLKVNTRGTPFAGTPDARDPMIGGHLADAPVGPHNFLKLFVLWPGESSIQTHHITADGRILYRAKPEFSGKPDSPTLRELLARRDANKVDRYNDALFLRRPDAKSDDAYFDLHVIHSVSVNRAGTMVAFAYSPQYRGSDPTRWGFGVMHVDRQEPELIDWPRMALAAPN